MSATMTEIQGDSGVEVAFAAEEPPPSFDEPPPGGMATLVIGEDDVLLREGIVGLLTEAGFDVVAQAGDGKDLLRKGLAHRPSVVIADVNMPPDHEDDGLRRRSSCDGNGPRPACWCSPSTTRSGTRLT